MGSQRPERASHFVPRIAHFHITAATSIIDGDRLLGTAFARAAVTSARAATTSATVIGTGFRASPSANAATAAGGGGGGGAASTCTRAAAGALPHAHAVDNARPRKSSSVRIGSSGSSIGCLFLSAVVAPDTCSHERFSYGPPQEPLLMGRGKGKEKKRRKEATRHQVYEIATQEWQQELLQLTVIVIM